MSYKIEWYDEASDDLEEIYYYYFSKNPKAAVKIYNSILEQTEYLITHPNIAAVEPLLKDKEFIFRSLVTKDGLFKIIYHVDTETNTVAIARVWCCRKNPKSLK